MSLAWRQRLDDLALSLVDLQHDYDTRQRNRADQKRQRSCEQRITVGLDRIEGSSTGDDRADTEASNRDDHQGRCEGFHGPQRKSEAVRNGAEHERATNRGAIPCS